MMRGLWEVYSSVVQMIKHEGQDWMVSMTMRSTQMTGLTRGCAVVSQWSCCDFNLQRSLPQIRWDLGLGNLFFPYRHCI